MHESHGDPSENNKNKNVNLFMYLSVFSFIGQRTENNKKKTSKKLFESFHFVRQFTCWGIFAHKLPCNMVKVYDRKCI